MNDSFAKMQSQLARAVVGLLYMALAALGLALIAARAGAAERGGRFPRRFRPLSEPCFSGCSC